jgi:hypothetical protein
MNELMAEVADAIEQTASKAGLLMMKAMIDDEVNQLVGPRYAHDQDRQAFRSMRDYEGVIADICDGYGIEEGLEETLTVNRLALPEELRSVFASTNMIESCFSLAHFAESLASRRCPESTIPDRHIAAQLL